MTQAASTKVFLTWSGERSKAMATALRDWLPSVIQAVDPWMSDSDIDKGAGWNPEISKQLEQAKIGIVCLTPENLDAPWVNFEAGALSKQTGSRVCTYLFGLSPTDVRGPLAQFQATRSDDKDDTKKLLQTINGSLGEHSLKGPTLDSVVEKWWPDLAAALKAIPHAHLKDQRPKRSQGDLLEEILQLVREQEKTSNVTVQTLKILAGAMQQFQIASKDYPVTPRGLLTMNAAHSVPSPMVGGGLLTTILGGSSPSEEAEEAAVLQAMVRNNAAIISALLDQKIKDSKG